MKGSKEASHTNVFILTLAFLLLLLRGSIFWPRWPYTDSCMSVSWFEVGMWMVLVLATIHTMLRNGDCRDFLNAWRKQFCLIFFLMFCLLSSIWSVLPSASLYRSLLTLTSCFIGAYIGFKYGIGGIVRILFWLGTAVLVFCYTMIIFLPSVSVMDWWPYNGAWRGFFWHRNYLGPIMSLFSIVFLITSIESFKHRNLISLTSLILYCVSFFLVFKAKSAAGYIIFILLNAMLFLSIIWLRVNKLLKAVHYVAAAVILAAVLIGVLLNLDIVLGLFNRNATFTGRIPLWSLLIKFVHSRLWFGYGFGAFWMIETVRTGLQHALGWLFPVAIADNGFLDILIHVGVIGFALFLIIWIISWIRSIQHARKYQTLTALFPLFFMVFTLLGNITFSFFMESEFLIWAIMNSVVFGMMETLERSDDALDGKIGGTTRTAIRA